MKTAVNPPGSFSPGHANRRILVLLLLIATIASGQQAKTRSLPRVTDPKEAWAQIKLRSTEELLQIVNELKMNHENCEDMNEEELREFVYDEDIMEKWFQQHPEEITKFAPKPNPKPERAEDKKEKEEASEVKTENEGTLSSLKNFFSRFFGSNEL